MISHCEPSYGYDFPLSEETEPADKLCPKPGSAPSFENV